MDRKLPEIKALFCALTAQARAADHRRLLVLSGGRGWGLASAGELTRELVAAAAPGRLLWLGAAPPPDVRGLSGREVLALLGTEADMLVVDAWSGFDPDAFGAVTGTVVSGGVVVLITPPLQQWPAYTDPELRRIAIAGVPQQAISGRFIRHVVTAIEQDPHAVVVQEHGPLPATPVSSATTPGSTRVAHPGPCKTAEQAQAVDAVLQVVRGHRRRPLVLTADRGRGKSAALGLAVAQLTAQLTTQRFGPVLVTAPDRRAVDAVFRHAGPEADLSYISPDRLLADRPACALLLVDEAAGLPVAALTELLGHYPRVVFATTVHGYEGTGRGFSLRFRQRLDALAPGWLGLHLQTPIRWAPNDPVERLTFRALLLDAAMDQPPATVCAAVPEIRRLDRDALLRDRHILEALFGLLVQAHYRTRPLDLRNLLDGPGLSIHGAFLGDCLIGAVLAVREGGFAAAMADAIWAGRRRPHGHLLPQSLAAHVGLRAGARQRALRIMRLAVHPDFQRRGTGAGLVQAAVSQARAEQLNLLGSSFGATPELLDFWSACGLAAVRVGSRRDAASGSHSVLMLHGLDDQGEAVAAEALRRFAAELPAQLTDPLRSLDPQVALALLQGLPALPQPQLQVWQTAASFAWGQRDFAVCPQALRSVSLWGLTRPAGDTGLAGDQALVLVQRVLQARDWKSVADAAGLHGRAAVLGLLRLAIGALVKAGAPPQVLADPLFRADQGG